MDIDLNIDNYELTDLLALFKLDFDFTEAELKQVKKMVLQTHPDKSQLEPVYFLFFSEAYKIITAVYQFRHKSTTTPTAYNTHYLVEKDEQKEALLHNLKNQPNFNKLFNELFDQYNITDADADNGYGDWLKSNENMDTRTTTLTGMNASFETKKKEVQALVRELWGANPSPPPVRRCRWRFHRKRPPSSSSGAPARRSRRKPSLPTSSSASRPPPRGPARPRTTARSSPR